MGEIGVAVVVPVDPSRPVPSTTCDSSRRRTSRTTSCPSPAPGRRPAAHRHAEGRPARPRRPRAGGESGTAHGPGRIDACPDPPSGTSSPCSSARPRCSTAACSGSTTPDRATGEQAAAANRGTTIDPADLEPDPLPDPQVGAGHVQGRHLHPDPRRANRSGARSAGRPRTSATSRSWSCTAAVGSAAVSKACGRGPNRLNAEGYVAFLPDYHLFTPGSSGPVFPWPEQNIKAAVQYLRGTAQALGISRKNIVVQGMSAGARVGAVAYTTPNDDYFAGPELWPDIPDTVNGFIGFYHPYDGSMQYSSQYYGGIRRQHERDGARALGQGRRDRQRAACRRSRAVHHRQHATGTSSSTNRTCSRRRFATHDEDADTGRHHRRQPRVRHRHGHPSEPPRRTGRDRGTSLAQRRVPAGPATRGADVGHRSRHGTRSFGRATHHLRHAPSVRHHEHNSRPPLVRSAATTTSTPSSSTSSSSTHDEQHRARPRLRRPPRRRPPRD